MQGNVPFARALLHKGADPLSVDPASYTPLHFASRVRDVEMRSLLISPSRMMTINSTNIGHTPLHSAALSGSIQVARLLLEAGHAINAQTCYGRTALQIAVECGDDRLARYLSGAGAIPMIQDDQQMTALWIQEKYADWFLGMTISLNPRITGGSETNPRKLLASRMKHRSLVTMFDLPASRNATLHGYAESEHKMI
jgi:ankyrin repeat protein